MTLFLKGTRESYYVSEATATVDKHRQVIKSNTTMYTLIMPLILMNFNMEIRYV